MIRIDINCDVGEGIGNEAQLMPFISSCNIACGAHAGDTATIDGTLQIALQNKVKIGAHPSFPDRKNFGRKVMDIPSRTLQKSIESQIRLILERIEITGATLNHVKAHGALYNLAAVDEVTALILVNAIQNTTDNVFLYAPYNSVLANVAIAKNQKVVFEAFADRNYNDDLSLVSRAQKNAVITNEKEVFEHVYQMVNRQKVTSITGVTIAIKASTFCVHGDTRNAIDLVKYLVQSLKEKGIQIY